MPNIEELKQAQQQLNPHTYFEQEPKAPKIAKPPHLCISVGTKQSKVSVGVDKKETQRPEGEGWVSPQEWQKEILNERQRIEEASKEIENWQAKIQERLGIIKELEVQKEKINKAAGELQQKIVLVKNENNTILYQMRNNIKHGDRIGDFKKDCEK